MGDVRGADLLSFAEVARIMNCSRLTARMRLMRHSHAHRFIVQIGNGAGRVHRRVSLQALQQAAPELFDRKDESIEKTRVAVREALSEITERLDDQARELDALEAAVGTKYREMMERVRKLEQAVMGRRS